MLLVAARSNAQSFDMALRIDLPTGDTPQAVAVADVNGDGRLDIVTCNHFSFSISVMLGTGGGGFSAPTDFPAGSYPSAIVVGDVNNDGRPDVVVTNLNSATVSVLLGNGAGAFGAPTPLATGSFPSAIALADVDHDGRPDLVVANSGGSTVSVLLGNGVGGFAPHVDYATGVQPSAVVLGDVNGDGNVDIVTANYSFTPVSILLGDGSGHFGSRTDIASSVVAQAAALSDVNGDGRPDLVTANPNTNTVSVYLSNGTGFGPPTDFPTGNSPYWVTVGDVTGDGKADLVTANSNDNTVSVLAGTGTGIFATHQDIAVGNGTRCVAIADVSGDGRPDLVVPGNNVNTASVLFARSGFGGRTTMATQSEPQGTAIVDLNHDGNRDIVVGEENFSWLGVFAGQGAGAFAPRADYTTGTNRPYALAIGDFTGDGELDAVTSYALSNSISLFPGTGTGAFGARTDFVANTGPLDLAVGDVNSDGAPDVVSTDFSGSTVSVFTYNATMHTLVKAGSFAAGPKPYGAAIGDLNGDGKGDIVVANDSVNVNTVTVMLGNGTGSFTTRATYATGPLPRSPRLADLNGDGKLDVVVANSGARTISVLPGTGAGSLGAKTDYPAGVAPRRVEVADVNGDGRLDVVADGDTLAILLGDGNGGFGTPTLLTAGSGSDHVALGDLNGDGRTDIVASAANSDILIRYFGLIPTQTRVATSASPVVFGAAMSLTATVSVPSGLTGASGNVSFFDGTTLLGTASLSGGSATLGLFAPRFSIQGISAVYAGDGKFAGSVSPALTVPVVSSARPAIAGISDVGNDQGGEVRLRFRRSPYDYLGSGTPITRYDVYRRIASGLAPASMTHAIPPMRSGAPTGPGPMRAQFDGWDYVGTTGARGDSAYALVVPTLADSNASGFHRATFLVSAVTGDPAVYYDSAADSGYSVDNLPPPPPSPFTAAYQSEATHLHWGQTVEPDLWYYRVYRGSSAGFVPGPSNVIATLADTGYVDPGPAGSWYKLSAVDVNGNESGYAVVSPSATTSAPGGAIVTTVSLAARPNPARGATTVQFALPCDAWVSLAVYDVEGRRVRTLWQGSASAGAHAETWDLFDDAQRPVDAGVVFVRLHVDGKSYVRRMVVIR